MKKNIHEPRQRILDAAISLFSKKGYDAVGIREIAQNAGVNSSMISYYFNGKVGILNEIITRFHDKYDQVLSDTDKEDIPAEERVKNIIRNMVTFIKANTDMVMVAFNTIPIDIPEIRKFKREKISSMIKKVSTLFREFSIDPKDLVQVGIIGPLLLSIILTHFRFKPIQKHLFNIEFDDSFYQTYIDIISTLFLYGITGIAKKKKIHSTPVHQSTGAQKEE
jgi:AcrR family transcriptional regulator